MTQRRLRKETAARIRALRPDLAARHDADTWEGLLAVRAAVAAEQAGERDEARTAVVVLSRLALAEWARGTCAFALGLDPQTAAGWRHSFTRTVFLAGNPAHLAGRFAFAHIAADRSAAWTVPGPAARSAGLRRLLKTFPGPAPVPAHPDLPLRVPGTPPPGGRLPAQWRLHLATAGCTVSAALVHLNHVLAEAALEGHLVPGDRLTISQRPHLAEVAGRLVAVRAVPADHAPGRLVAAAALTEEPRDA
nr:DUF6182 family protein [Streptomyces harenosi]